MQGQVLTATVDALTLTIDSFVWAMSEMTPSVMMRSTKYWEPSFTEAAYLHTKTQKSHLCHYFCAAILLGIVVCVF